MGSAGDLRSMPRVEGWYGIPLTPFGAPKVTSARSTCRLAMERMSVVPQKCSVQVVNGTELINTDNWPRPIPLLYHFY